MRGCCERALGLLCIAVLLAAPRPAVAKRHGAPQHGDAAAVGAPPNQTDFFQSLSLGSNKEPINISADSLELDYKGSVLTYSGNVKVVQGDTTLTSDRLAITYDRSAVSSQPSPTPTPGAAAAPAPSSSPAARRLGGDGDKIKEVVAEGHVRIQRGDRIAEGRRAVFDQATQTIVLSDGAVLHEGPNHVNGDRIIVYLQEERSVVESGSNSRVSAVFYPNASASGQPTPGASGHPTPAATVSPEAAARSAVQVGGAPQPGAGSR